MDWKYKHFNQEAIFNAPIQSLLEVARAVVAEAFGEIEDTPDGFIARGHSAWHAASATFHVASAPAGTRLTVELLVERASGRGYMLVDVGGYYNAQIDKWFAHISERLGAAGEQALISKSTSGFRIQRGCLAGCLAWLVAGACLGLGATALDRALSPQSSGSFPGPFSIAASLGALLAGGIAFLYVAYPDGPTSKFIKERLLRIQGNGEK
jgi:hypothetical protein